MTLWRDQGDIKGDVDVDAEMASRVEAGPEYIAVRHVSKGDGQRFSSGDSIPTGLFTPKDIEWLLQKGAIEKIGD